MVIKKHTCQNRLTTECHKYIQISKTTKMFLEKPCRCMLACCEISNGKKNSRIRMLLKIHSNVDIAWIQLLRMDMNDDWIRMYTNVDIDWL